MTGKTFIGQFAVKALWAGVLLLAFSGQIALAQAAPGRFVGTITAINGDTLTVKPDSGDVRQVEVPSTAALKRVEGRIVDGDGKIIHANGVSCRREIRRDVSRIGRDRHSIREVGSLPTGCRF